MRIRDIVGERHIDPGAAGNAPTVVRASVYFWLASAVVSQIVPMMVVLVFHEAAPREPVWLGVAFVLVFTSLLSWAAFQLLRGAGWVRPVLSGAAAVEVLGVDASGAIPSGLVFAGLVLTLAAVVLMWLPASNAFFRRAPVPVGG